MPFVTQSREQPNNTAISQFLPCRAKLHVLCFQAIWKRSTRENQPIFYKNDPLSSNLILIDLTLTKSVRIAAIATKSAEFLIEVNKFENLLINDQKKRISEFN